MSRTTRAVTAALSAVAVWATAASGAAAAPPLPAPLPSSSASTPDPAAAAARPTTVLVTAGPDGRHLGGREEFPVGPPDLSRDGRWLAFMSDRPLLPGVAAGEWHVYLRDMRSGVLRRVDRDALTDVSYQNRTEVSLSASGRYLAFSTSTPQTPGRDGMQAYLYDAVTRTLSRIGPASDMGGPSLGASDGRYLNYDSYDQNLAPGPVPTRPNLTAPQSYIYDTTTRRFSRALDRIPGVRIEDYSAGVVSGGRYVVAYADAALTRDGKGPGVFRRPTGSKRWTRLPQPPGGNGAEYPLDVAAPRYYVYSTKSRLVKADRNRLYDVYRWDARTGRLALLSVGPDGAACRSADPWGASTGDGDAGAVDHGTSSDGTVVVFTSNCTQLVGERSGQEHLFVRDLVHHTTRAVDVDARGRLQRVYGLTDGDGYGLGTSLSGDGRWIAFVDTDPSLVDVGGPGGGADLYLRGPLR
ncbi:MAG TPA: hypothetical protein VE781_11215 [Kineosporiaceae bacterium]|nr:hypothetical protein [Kineosporiaceae bacterium]